MKNNKIIYIFALILISMIAIQCDAGFDEVNTNPNDATTAPSNAFLAGNLQNIAKRVHDRGLGITAGTWTQQIQKPQYNDADKYIVDRGDFYHWESMYTYIGKLSDMQRLAQEEGNKKIEAVAIILKSYLFQKITDSWGYAPYTEAAQFAQGNFTPAYDSPETIYEGLYNDLNNAITLIDMGGNIEPGQDILYAGDAAKWKKFANSLLFRLIIRGQNFTTFNHTADLATIAPNTFMSNSEEAKIKFIAEPNDNPYYNIVQTSREGEWAIGEKLVELMDGTVLGASDNRLPVYAKPNPDGNYIGLPAGLNEPGTDFADVASGIGEEYLKFDASFKFITYAQVLLLKAEAAERGYIGSSAATHYADAINASFDANGAILGGYPTIYVGGVSGLTQIAQQEYIALYMQPLEAYAEWRRTGIPALTPAVAGVINEVPSRFLYPATETTLNAANYNSAISAQGADNLTTHIGWMN